MLTIKSRSHDYTVESFDRLDEALRAVTNPGKAYYLIDHAILRHYKSILCTETNTDHTLVLEVSESLKSFENLAPLFLELIRRGLKRDGLLVVVGGGVVQDVGCFISSVLFRGLHWELIPTTLLAQADSCVGSKSSINIGPYKNQIGTFYPPNRVLLPSEVLTTLPWNEIRSGIGEIVKLQLLKGPREFDELLADLAGMSPLNQRAVITKWIPRSIDIKRTYIEVDEYDRGVRNLLNYGHTFAHAYESATCYRIPHGIAVTLGILTATYLSKRLCLVSESHYEDLMRKLAPWHMPYGKELQTIDRTSIIDAIKYDKKNAGGIINCILTQGPGKMAKRSVDLHTELAPALHAFIDQELTFFETVSR